PGKRRSGPSGIRDLSSLPRGPARPDSQTRPASAPSQLNVLGGVRYGIMNGMRGMSSSAAVTATGPERQRADTNVATMTALRPTGLNDRDDDRHGAGGTALRERAAEPFTQAALDCAAERPGQTVVLLQVGATTAGDELDAARLHMAGCDVAVTLIDDDTATASAAVAGRPDLGARTPCDPPVA